MADALIRLLALADAYARAKELGGTMAAQSHRRRLVAELESALPAPAAPQPCAHEWVSARNNVVKNGSICGKCYALDPREPGEIPTLSDRVRPGSEAAPWVCEEIRKLEADLSTALQSLRETTQYAISEGSKLRTRAQQGRELLAKANTLYSTYGLVCGKPPEADGVGEWICDVRDFLAEEARRDLPL